MAGQRERHRVGVFVAPVIWDLDDSHELGAVFAQVVQEIQGDENSELRGLMDTENLVTIDPRHPERRSAIDSDKLCELLCVFMDPEGSGPEVTKKAAGAMPYRKWQGPGKDEKEGSWYVPAAAKAEFLDWRNKTRKRRETYPPLERAIVYDVREIRNTPGFQYMYDLVPEALRALKATADEQTETLEKDTKEIHGWIYDRAINQLWGGVLREAWPLAQLDERIRELKQSISSESRKNKQRNLQRKLSHLKEVRAQVSKHGTTKEEVLRRGPPALALGRRVTRTVLRTMRHIVDVVAPVFSAACHCEKLRRDMLSDAAAEADNAAEAAAAESVEEEEEESEDAAEAAAAESAEEEDTVVAIFGPRFYPKGMSWADVTEDEEENDASSESMPELSSDSGTARDAARKTPEGNKFDKEAKQQLSREEKAKAKARSKNGARVFVAWLRGALASVHELFEEGGALSRETMSVSIKSSDRKRELARTPISELFQSPVSGEDTVTEPTPIIHGLVDAFEYEVGWLARNTAERSKERQDAEKADKATNKQRVKEAKKYVREKKGRRSTKKQDTKERGADAEVERDTSKEQSPVDDIESWVGEYGAGGEVDYSGNNDSNIFWGVEGGDEGNEDENSEEVFRPEPTKENARANKSKPGAKDSQQQRQRQDDVLEYHLSRMQSLVDKLREQKFFPSVIDQSLSDLIGGNQKQRSELLQQEQQVVELLRKHVPERPHNERVEHWVCLWERIHYYYGVLDEMIKSRELGHGATLAEELEELKECLNQVSSTRKTVYWYLHSAENHEKTPETIPEKPPETIPETIPGTWAPKQKPYSVFRPTDLDVLVAECNNKGDPLGVTPALEGSGIQLFYELSADTERAVKFDNVAIVDLRNPALAEDKAENTERVEQDTETEQAATAEDAAQVEQDTMTTRGAETEDPEERQRGREISRRLAWWVRRLCNPFLGLALINRAAGEDEEFKGVLYGSQAAAICWRMAMERFYPQQLPGTPFTLSNLRSYKYFVFDWQCTDLDLVSPHEMNRICKHCSKYDVGGIQGDFSNDTVRKLRMSHLGTQLPTNGLYVFSPGVLKKMFEWMRDNASSLTTAGGKRITNTKACTRRTRRAAKNLAQVELMSEFFEAVKRLWWRQCQEARQRLPGVGSAVPDASVKATSGTPKAPTETSCHIAMAMSHWEGCR